MEDGLLRFSYETHVYNIYLYVLQMQESTCWGIIKTFQASKTSAVPFQNNSNIPDSLFTESNIIPNYFIMYFPPF